jgi:hypothetical protein
MKNTVIAIITIALLILSNVIGAQTVEVINKSDYNLGVISEDFAFIEPTTDSTDIHFIARIKASAKKDKTDVGDLFYKIRATAQKLGANAFKLRSYEKADVGRKPVLVLDTYYIADSSLSLNFDNHEKNVIYIFGDSEKSDKIYSFKINNTKKEIKGGTFYKLENKEGQEVKISTGGFTGATVWIKWKENKPATFLSLTGLGLGGGTVPAGQIGMSFNTGRINPINGDLGHLLAQLLMQSE